MENKQAFLTECITLWFKVLVGWVLFSAIILGAGFTVLVLVTIVEAIIS